MIQEIEYQNSILCSGFGAAWNSKTQSDINPTKNVYRATIKHSIKDPFSHLVFDIPLQVFIIRSKFKIQNSKFDFRLSVKTTGMKKTSL